MGTKKATETETPAGMIQPPATTSVSVSVPFPFYRVRSAWYDAAKLGLSIDVGEITPADKAEAATFVAASGKRLDLSVVERQQALLRLALAAGATEADIMSVSRAARNGPTATRAARVATAFGRLGVKVSSGGSAMPTTLSGLGGATGPSLGGAFGGQVPLAAAPPATTAGERAAAAAAAARVALRLKALGLEDDVILDVVKGAVG